MAADVVHERTITGETTPHVKKCFACNLRWFGLTARENIYDESDV
jgi:hypothetical protein